MKLKKLLAIGMTVTLAFTTLAGCGNEEKSAADNDKKGTFKSSLESGMALESYTYESVVTFTANGKSFVGSIDDETKELLSIKDDSISAKLNLNGKKAGTNVASTLGVTLNDKISADFLDVMVVDDTIYIGTEKLVNGLGTLFNEILGMDVSDEIDSMKPEGNYIKVTEEMLISLLGEYSSGNLGINDMIMSEISEALYPSLISGDLSAEDKEQMQEIITYFLGFFEKAISKSESDLYSSDGDQFKFTISNDNINKLVKSLAEVIESDSEEVSKKLTKLSGEEITASQVTSIVSMLKSYDVAALLDVEFSLEVTTEFKDDTWKFGVSFELKKNDESVKISIDHKAVEDKDLKISAPTDLVSDEDVEKMILKYKEDNGLTY